MPAMRSMVMVRSLSVRAHVGAPPIARRVASRQASSDPSVRSQVGMTTRKRLHASQAQNRRVGRPPIIGPAPQSNWSHMPGSVTHGR